MVKHKILFISGYIFLVSNFLTNNLVAQSNSAVNCTNEQFASVVGTIRTGANPTERLTLKNNLNSLLACVKNKAVELSNSINTSGSDKQNGQARLSACNNVQQALEASIKVLDNNKSNFSVETVQTMRNSLDAQLAHDSKDDNSLSNVVNCFGVSDKTFDFTH